jgi:hypothetical protein
MAEELSSRLLALIHASIPTFQAAEALLFLAAHRDRDFSIEEVVVGMRPRIIGAADVHEYSALFSEGRLVAAANDRFRYAPASAELERSVGELSRAYNERPVTLIVTICHVASGIIQLADSSTSRAD